MYRLLIFLVPSILFNLTGLIDTFLVNTFGKEKSEGNLENGIGSLMIVGWCVAWIVALGLFPFVYQEIFAIQWQTAGYLLLWGIAYGIAAIPYFKALETEQVENILPMYQMIPLIAYVMGILMLWEIIPWWQLALIIGIIMITWLFYIDFKHLTFNKKALWRCGVSIIFYAASFVLFKKWWLAENNLGVSLFWEHIGVVLTGMVFFVQTAIRKTTIKYFVKAWRKFSILNIFNELFFISGIILQNYISLHYLIVYMSIITNGGQVLLGFLMKYIAHQRKPHLYQRSYSKKSIIIKIALSLVVLCGLFYIGKFIT